jgi:hypothetical protein
MLHNEMKNLKSAENKMEGTIMLSDVGNLNPQVRHARNVNGKVDSVEL